MSDRWQDFTVEELCVLDNSLEAAIELGEEELKKFPAGCDMPDMRKEILDTLIVLRRLHGETWRTRCNKDIDY